MTEDSGQVTEKKERKKPSPVVRPPSTEQGGPKGPEPTRYGDWEKDGKCVDF